MMLKTLARVAKVNNEFELILNKGKTDGVEEGDNFLVYELGEEIIDPESGENLGALEIVKGRGRVSHVQDRVCTVRTSKTHRAPEIRKINPDLGAVIPRWTNRAPDQIIETAKITEIPFSRPKIGDFARPV